MSTLLIFGATLLIAVLISELADRTIVSTAVLFLLVGFTVGGGVLSYINVEPGSPAVSGLADFALVAVLFTDAMKLGWGKLRHAWQLPGRALFFGLPLTLGITALFGHYVAQLSWLNAWLVGAALSPTDPVFASAIVGREGISPRLRHLLNVESGLNDGLALPIVVGILAVGGAAESTLGEQGFEILGGCAIGIVVPWIALRFERTRFFAVARSHESLLPVAIGLTVFALAELVHANQFLAAFSAGVTVATMRPREADASVNPNALAEQLAELLKLAAVLVFGVLISPQFLREIPWTGYLFAALALLVARPVALFLSLLGTAMDRRERLAAMWFGPKGFASVIYGILILRSGVTGANETFHLVALVTVSSIIAHSSTDVVIARWLRCDAESNPQPSQA